MTATKTAATPVPAPVVDASLIDEYGRVTALRDAFAPTEKLYQALKARIALCYVDADPEKVFTAEGEIYRVDVSMCSNESKLDVPRVRKLLGAATFLEVVNVTKKALESFLCKPDIEALCTVTRTGSRTYAPTAIPKT